jgi:hypothetical protein
LLLPDPTVDERPVKIPKSLAEQPRTPLNSSSARPPQAAEAALAGLGYLAALDPAQLPACAQAELLHLLEQAHALETAARAQVLGAFTAGQGYHEDGCYGSKSWLINHLGITKGAATGYVSWTRRGGAHPRVLAALAAAQIVESVARTVCDWTDKLPADCRDCADAILVAAALSGASLEDLARLAAEIYARSRPPDPGDRPGGFDDRSVRLETTFEGAGVLGGALTPEMRRGGRGGAGRAVGSRRGRGPADPRAALPRCPAGRDASVSILHLG